MQNWLNSNIKYIKGVGPAKANLLNKLGIFTVKDLVEHYPRRYEDRSKLSLISQLSDGQSETFIAIVYNITESRPRRGLVVTRVTVRDSSGLAHLVWFNQPYKKKVVKVGLKIIVSGKVQKKFNGIEIANPEVELLDGVDTLHTGRIVPIYPASENLSQKYLRILLWNALKSPAPQDGDVSFPETLPEEILCKYDLLDRTSALTHIHFPSDEKILLQARRRLVFEELYLMQCGLCIIRRNRRLHCGIKHRPDLKMIKQFESSLPFKLTAAQQQALQEIKADMEDITPMQRLLQGDVGAGKTIVAAIALIKTVENGFQGAMMAPTELLAEQHFRTLQELFAPLKKLRIALLTGSVPSSSRTKLLTGIKSGVVDIVIGTHALIQNDVEFSQLGLVVTDEQHRFGVMQRVKLQEKGNQPDVLFMTATPIPRTMALTVYGDLDVSVIRHLPPGRKPIRTFLRNRSSRNRIYDFVIKEIQKGRQAYVVCPLIEESVKIEAQSATELYNLLTRTFLKNINCGLVHGKMSAKERDAIMHDFYAGKIKVLIATTVIEVGVNVPNATIMIIEDAERFGLAQLHQLRGRIGRGNEQSYCILISDNPSKESLERLTIITNTSDGFDLAEKDLQLRGPGQFFGTKQHGMPDLKIANIIEDIDILLEARTAAQTSIANPQTFESIRPAVLEWFGGSDNIKLVNS